MATPPRPPITLCKTFSETNRVFKTQSHRFLGLAFLFFFPTTIGNFIYQTLKSLKNPGRNTNGVDVIILLAAPVVLFLYVTLFPSAVISITYTAFNGLNNVPVDHKSAIKSITSSFFPLLGTLLAAVLLIFLVVIAFSGLFILTTLLAGPAAPILGIILALILVAVLIYLLANWSLADSVVVVESKWGFGALKRSKELIKGKRRLFLGFSFIFWLIAFVFFSIHFVVQILLVTYYFRQPQVKLWMLLLSLVVQYLITAFLITFLQLYKTVANTVLYVHCNSNRRRGGDYSGEYVPLPAGDERVASNA